jgi:YggT family protein
MSVDVVRWVFYYLLFFFWLLLTARIVVELVRSFARSWQPVGGVAIALESVYTMTDPPVRALRRLIKPIRIGGIGLDLSIMVLLFVVLILMHVVEPTRL